jgi:Na+/H+ antiporter NhaD/arsenite permease-like protein
MNLAWISVAALVLAVILSCTTTINVGVVALALALLVGVYGGMSPDAVLAGFPVALFITLVGVTLLFSIAESNGTLARLTARAVRVCRGHAGVLPIMFFVLGLFIATIGAGATPASALLAPPAMAVAGRAGVPPFLMVIMAGHGVLAGTLSPFAPNGIVANGVMTRIGLGGVEWQTYGYTALAHTIVGFGGFFLLGGWRLFKRHDVVQAVEPELGAMDVGHWLATAGIATLIVAVAGFGMNVGMVAIIIATLLILLRSVDEQKAIKGMPWGVILMVTGVTVLVALLEETEGLDLFTSGIARISTPATIAPIVAFGTGVVSVYSSTGGVVLPAFLPMAPDLAQRMGGVEPQSIAWAMSVGSSLVDLSSLSTVGALFIAGAAAGSDTRRLFNSLIAWGFSMAFVAAAISWILFGLA